MEHLIIQAYSDDKFRSKQGGQITILLNPENIKTGKTHFLQLLIICQLPLHGKQHSREQEDLH